MDQPDVAGSGPALRPELPVEEQVRVAVAARRRRRRVAVGGCAVLVGAAAVLASRADPDPAGPAAAAPVSPSPAGISPAGSSSGQVVDVAVGSDRLYALLGSCAGPEQARGCGYRLMTQTRGGRWTRVPLPLPPPDAGWGFAARLLLTGGDTLTVLDEPRGQAYVSSGGAPVVVRRIRDGPPLAERPSDEEIALLAKVLNKSERITILGGAGCAGAHVELIEVAGKLNAPIVHALRGKEFIEYDNPFDVGMTGLLGFTSGYHAMMNCTTLLMIGTDFPYQQFFPKQATIVQIDLRGEQLGRRTKLDYGFVGDTKSTLRALLPKLKQNADDKRLKQSVEHYRKARKGLDELATEGREKKGSHPQYVARVISELASDDAVFTCDVGTLTIWAARSHHEWETTLTRVIHSRING